MSTDVTVCECWPRDGIQGWPVVDTEEKLRVIDAIVASGFREIDATSFVPISVVPQFFDAEPVLRHLGTQPVSVRVVAPNRRGFERAAEVSARTGGIDTVGFPISASEPHNLANVRRTHDEHLVEIREMIRIGHEAGMRVIGAVATAFGCPIQGYVSEENVFDIAHRLVDAGLDRMMLSDTTGLADPIRVRAYMQRAKEQFPDVELVAHFHDTRGTGLLNTWAALEAGVDVIDSCLGGLGGEPAAIEQNHSGETGNIATEDLVVALERAGYRTGVDIDRMLTAAALQETIVGAPSRAQVMRTGTGLEALGPRTEQTSTTR